MTELEFKPNDVIIIFRPNISDDNNWNGNYNIFISGIGPLTLSEDEIGTLVSSAMLTASCAKLLETDEDLAEKAYNHCKESFGDIEYTSSAPIQLSLFDEEYFLNENTPTIGGVQ